MSPAQKGDLVKGRLELHKELKKAESSAAIQMRTGKIGFNHFLYTRRVPGVPSPTCQCGWWKQDVKHILLFCPDYFRGRMQMMQEASTIDVDTML